MDTKELYSHTKTKSQEAMQKQTRKDLEIPYSLDTKEIKLAWQNENHTRMHLLRPYSLRQRITKLA